MPRKQKSLRRLFYWIATAVAATALAAFLLWPRPVEADLASVTRGRMRVVVREDGKTRVQERYVISAPLAGRMARIELHAGDDVVADQTVLLAIEPTAPALLDERALLEAEARVRAAEAARELAQARLDESREAHELATHQLERIRELHASGSAAQEEFDQVEHRERQASHLLRAMQFGLQVAAFELELARAALVRTRPGDDGGPPEKLLVRSPVTGKVLRVLQESAGVVLPGQPILEVGDASRMEVEIDVLSSDAAAIRPGAEVSLEQWGGSRPLKGRVLRVEPSGFTKVSALGVEEQRVDVIAELLDPPALRRGLGDGFRVEAEIVVWEAERVVKAPSGALFRSGQDWAVYVVQQSIVRKRKVQIGRNNGDEAQVLGGLAPGELVVMHPGDKVREGVRVTESPLEGS